MDLLEIRKKAKEKEGGDKGQPPAGAPAAAPAEGQPEVPSEVPAKKEKKEKRRRRSGKKAAVTAAKPDEPEAVQPVELAEETETVVEEVLDSLPEEALPPPAGNAGNAGKESKTDASAVAEVTASTSEAPDEIIEYLAFLLANEEYAVKVEDVKEIIRGQSITTVPRTPGFVIGIISLRGVILPVFDIKKRLGLEDGVVSRKTSRIIVVADKYGLQGIMVDKVTGVVKLKGSAIEPPPAIIGGVEAEYLQGLGRIGDRLLILFNTDRVLTVG